MHSLQTKPKGYNILCRRRYRIVVVVVSWSMSYTHLYFFYASCVPPCVCQVDGHRYSGQGRSKKMARLIAAESALRNFIQLKDCAVLIKSSHIQDAASLDFTSDELLNENGAGGGVGGAANGNE